MEDDEAARFQLREIKVERLQRQQVGGDLIG
jgi:hypothetical protein